MPRRTRAPRPFAAVILMVAAAAATISLTATPADAHGFASTVYVDVTAPTPDTVRATLELEYDLLVVSAAENSNDPGLFDDGMDLFETGEEATALNGHTAAVVEYVTDRFTVTAAGEACAPAPVGAFTVEERDGVPYAILTLDFDCGRASADGHEVRSGLFPDEEQYVADTKTIVTYEIDGASGSAALDAEHPSFSTEQDSWARFGEFFLLGAEHLLSGLDHILFLLALIVGSRRLRDVVIAASAFTIAHSVTFLLAALGLVAVPAAIVEPIIALSIAVVAAWYLWVLWRGRADAAGLTTPAVRGHLGMGRADWTRIAVVFCFGLVHGLGFAGALGIDEAWSWTLLWSLLVFNVGIEAVQLGVIAIVFPLLTLLRRRSPRVGLWVGAAVAAVVTVIGLFWFGQRVLGLG